MINPCYDCDHRKWDCHGTCKAYKKWSIYNEKMRKKRRAKEQIERLKW